MASSHKVYALGDAALVNIAQQLSGGSSSGAGGEGTEARIARLESSVDHIQHDVGEIKLDIREIKNDAKSDFKIYFAALIASVLGLAGMMAKGFHWF
jgi:hypothetical protein